MKVSIDHIIYDYIPDFNPKNPSENRWRKQNQDSFKFIELGGNKIFVKRFDKDRAHISGYDFLLKIKGQKIAGFPRIYDLTSQEEEGYRVYYLFQEVLEGDTLENIINHSVLHFNPLLFSLRLYDALNTIISQGFWYTDFVEKNIFIGKDGNAYLIDLDSVASIQEVSPRDKLMSNDVNNNYKGSVCKDWYVDTYHYEASEVLKKIKGDTVNFLELVLLIGQFRYYFSSPGTIDFLGSKIRASAADFLKFTDHKFIEAIFKSCFEPNSNHQQSINKTLFTAFIQKLFPESGPVIIDFKEPKISGLSTLYNDVRQKRIDILFTHAKNDLDKMLFKEARHKIREILSIDPGAYDVRRFLNTIQTTEKIYHLMVDSKQALHYKNFSLTKRKANETLLIDPYYSDAKILLDQISDEEKYTVDRLSCLNQEISELKRSQSYNFWLLRILMHVFLGFGLFGLTDSLRKWIYPVADLMIIVFLWNYRDEYLPFIAIFLCITFAGYIDVIVTSVKKVKETNILLIPLQSEKKQLSPVNET